MRNKVDSQGHVTSLSDLVQFDVKAITTEIRNLIGERLSSSTGAYAFKLRYLMDNIDRKYNDGSGNDKFLRESAYANFLHGEGTCATLNHSFDISTTDKSIIESARKIVRGIIGSFSYAKVLNVKHSGGATSHRPRAFGNASYKYKTYSDDPLQYYSQSRRKTIRHNGLLTCTPLAFRYAEAFFSNTMLADCTKNIVLVRGNTLDFVPKDNRTHRTIAKEPCINMFFQLGVGEYFANCLSRIGNSKYDQGRNQAMAHSGSVYGHLATIDLARASDSLSFALVYALLDNEWSQYLDDIRSHYYLCPITNRYKLYEKFSSMGNGFTFELQTIIFYALALASANVKLRDDRRLFSTYGDDIIVPTCTAHEVIRVLEVCGFSTNIEKTFITGPFRESCGKHYYNGIDVTPIYIRKPLDNIQRCIWLLNHIRRWSFDSELGVCDDLLHDLWLGLYRSHPIFKKVRGGRDLYSTSQVVTPGRARYSVCEKTTRIVMPEVLHYRRFLAQGCSVSDESLEGRQFTDGTRIIDSSELYHYIIHPESNKRTKFFLQNLVVPTEQLFNYHFLTETN